MFHVLVQNYVFVRDAQYDAKLRGQVNGQLKACISSLNTQNERSRHSNRWDILFSHTVKSTGTPRA